MGKSMLGRSSPPHTRRWRSEIFHNPYEAFPEILRHAAFPRHPAIITVQDVMMTTMVGPTKAVGLLFPWYDLDLQRFIKKLPLKPAGVRLVLRRVCEALAHLHASGLVHTDVKPDNIFLRLGSGCLGAACVFQALRDAAVASAEDDTQSMLKNHLQGALEVHRCCCTEMTTI